MSAAEPVTRSLPVSPQDTAAAVGPAHVHVTVWLDREPEVHSELALYLTRAALDRVIEAIDAEFEALKEAADAAREQED